MKKLLLVLFVVVYSLTVFGQQELEGRAINRALIYTADSDSIEGQYIVFLKDSVEFYLENSQTRYALGLNQVTEVLEYKGNYGLTGSLIGTLAGAGIAFAITSGSDESSSSNLPGLISDEELASDALTIGLSIAIGGALGYLIGQAIEDWETVYSRSTAFINNLNINLNNYRGLTVSYKVYF